jgi:cell division protein FtsQ
VSANDWTVSRSGGPFSLRELLRRRSQRHRRSRARLQEYRAQAEALRADRVARSRPAVQISGGAALNLVLAFALVGVLVWFFVSERFYVTQIVVEGQQRVSAEAIAAVSELYGYSIFWVDRSQVAEAITSALPPIRAVRVRTGLPNTVVLTVEEQGEQVMWLAEGQRYWVDEQGAFHPAQGGNDPTLLVHDLRPGALTEVDPAVLQAARELAEEMPELSTVDYTASQGLQFRHERGWLVILGVSDNMAERVSRFRALERQYLQEGAQQPALVDVRFAKPYSRPEGE